MKWRVLAIAAFLCVGMAACGGSDDSDDQNDNNAGGSSSSGGNSDNPPDNGGGGEGSISGAGGVGGEAGFGGVGGEPVQGTGCPTKADEMTSTSPCRMAGRWTLVDGGLDNASCVIAVTKMTDGNTYQAEVVEVDQTPFGQLTLTGTQLPMKVQIVDEVNDEVLDYEFDVNENSQLVVIKQIDGVPLHPIILERQ